MARCYTSKYIKVNVADPCDVFTSTTNSTDKLILKQDTKFEAKVMRNINPRFDKQKKSFKVDHLVINVGKNSDIDEYEWFTRGPIIGFLIPCFSLLAVLAVVLVSDAFRIESNADSTNVLVYDGVHKYMSWPDPPPRSQLASVARYVIHISEWGSLATNSTHKGIEGYPFVNIFSVSDGPYDNSTGVPYFYFTPLELSVLDIEASNKVSLTVTEAQSDFCNRKGYDPEDPRCAHVILTGSIKKIEQGSEEEEFARNALFSRHVEMKEWPAGHDWFFAKLDIINIYLLDYFGGVATVTVDDYFAANPFGKNMEELIMK